MPLHPPTPGRLLLSLSAIFLPTGAFIADFFTYTHIFNPRWTPHAKFHGGQTLGMSVALAAMGLYLTWRRPNQSKPQTVREQKQTLWDAKLVLDLYWVTQFCAILFPGTRMMDPEFGDGYIQIYLEAGAIAVNTLGYYLEAARVEKVESEKGELGKKRT